MKISHLNLLGGAPVRVHVFTKEKVLTINAVVNINLFAIIVKYCLGNPHDLSGMYRMNLTMS